MADFEKLREENVAKNRALLAKLELENAVDNLGVAKPPTKAVPARKTKRKSEEQDSTPTPRRASSRLKRVLADPNETPEQRRDRLAEEEERHRLEEEQRLEAEEQARAAKRPRHEQLDLSTLGANLDDDELLALRKTLGVVCTVKQEKGVGDDAQTWDDTAIEDRDLGALKDAVKSLRLVSRAKVTKDRVSCMAYHPERTKDLIFFGDRHGRLGVWDARAAPQESVDSDGDVVESAEGGRTWALQMHWPATSMSSISSIKLDPGDAHSLFTTAYDCTIRQWSFTSGASRELLSFANTKTLLTCLDLPPHGNELWASDALGGLSHMDLREDRSKARRYELFEHKIGSVSVNPNNPFALLTASNNRFLTLWDARKFSKIPVATVDVAAADDDEAPSLPTADFDDVQAFLSSKAGKGTVKGEWQHDKSCSSAYWNPTGRFVVSTSYDNKLRYWNVWPDQLRRDGVLGSFRPTGHVDHDCQTGRWVTVFKAQWSPNPDAYPHFTVGNMDHSLNIITFKGDVIGRLHDKNKITAVQAVTASHPSILARAASGNGSGRCVLWADTDERT